MHFRLGVRSKKLELARYTACTKSLGGCEGETARTRASTGRREKQWLGYHGYREVFISIHLYIEIDLMMFPSGNAIKIAKGANGEELQGCEVQTRV